MLAGEEGGSDEELKCLAILMYAAYNTTNHMRQHGSCNHDTAGDAIEQGIRNATSGHAKSRYIIDNRYIIIPIDTYNNPAIGRRVRRRLNLA